MDQLAIIVVIFSFFGIFFEAFENFKEQES